MTGAEKDRLAELIRSHRNVFALADAVLGRTNLANHRINRGVTDPINFPPLSRISSEDAYYQEKVQSIMEKGVIQFFKVLYQCSSHSTVEGGRWLAVLLGLQKTDLDND